MTDNDPAATAALAERVAELDRLFPRREETTGRAMCAGWGPTRTSFLDRARCTSTTATATRTHRCALDAGHDGNHRDGDDPHTARGWTDDAPKPRTVDFVSDDHVTVTVADVPTTRLLERRLASARMSLDALRAHVAELERSLADRKPPTVRRDVASVTT